MSGARYSVVLLGLVVGAVFFVVVVILDNLAAILAGETFGLFDDAAAGVGRRISCPVAVVRDLADAATVLAEMPVRCLLGAVLLCSVELHVVAVFIQTNF